MALDEGGPKSNQNTYNFLYSFLILVKNLIWLVMIVDCPLLGQSASGLNFDSGCSLLAD
jgi:hypothetical protein